LEQMLLRKPPWLITACFCFGNMYILFFFFLFFFCFQTIGKNDTAFFIDQYDKNLFTITPLSGLIPIGASVSINITLHAQINSMILEDLTVLIRGYKQIVLKLTGESLEVCLCVCRLPYIYMSLLFVCRLLYVYVLIVNIYFCFVLDKKKKIK
jgi:hypothetical protein